MYINLSGLLDFGFILTIENAVSNFIWGKYIQVFFNLKRFLDKNIDINTTVY